MVVPALNEEHRLGSMLHGLRVYVAQNSLPVAVEVIVVDNDSTDATAEVAWAASTSELPVRVVRCAVRGKGAAVRAGVAATDADLVGYMDADGATSFAAIMSGLFELSLGAEVAIGSRAVFGSDVTARHRGVRKRGATLFRGLAARVVPGVSDTQCGFKLMSGRAARALCSEQSLTGFTFDVELLALAQRRGLVISEFPVTWTDIPGSTFSPARHGLSSFVGIARVAWRMRGVTGQDNVTILTQAATPALLEPLLEA